MGIADLAAMINMGTGGAATGRAMKTAAEYLETAHQFERLAATTADPNLKVQFLDQAANYRKLAQGRIAQCRSQMPPSRRQR
jgi:hypothetical protein